MPIRLTYLKHLKGNGQLNFFPKTLLNYHKNKAITGVKETIRTQRAFYANLLFLNNFSLFYP